MREKNVFHLNIWAKQQKHPEVTVKKLDLFFLLLNLGSLACVLFWWAHLVQESVYNKDTITEHHVFRSRLIKHKNKMLKSNIQCLATAISPLAYYVVICFNPVCQKTHSRGSHQVCCVGRVSDGRSGCDIQQRPLKRQVLWGEGRESGHDTCSKCLHTITLRSLWNLPGGKCNSFNI